MIAATAHVSGVVELVNEHIAELDGRATSSATFSEIQIDSLVCVEMAVLLGQHYGVQLEEHDVAEAGDFPTLAELISRRQQAREEGSL